MTSKRSDFLYKTELCLNFMSDIACPHWPNCRFAHGNSELRSLALQDIESKMGIDINMYRTRPCFDYIATGSCPFGARCKAIHDPRAKGPVESWLRHTKFPLCSKVLNLDSISYIDHLHTITSEFIHEGNPVGITLTKNPIEEQFENFYNRITNKCGGMDILALKIASTFLKDSPENLLKYNPTHSYIGQACSVESKVFIVRFSVDHGFFSVHEMPQMLSNTLMPNIIVAHLIKVGQPSKSNPVRVYFGSIPQLEFASKDDIKAAIRKQSSDTNELDIHLPFLELLIPCDDDALDLVRDILIHKISSMDGTFDDYTSKGKAKELMMRFTSLLQFFKSQWFPTNKSHDLSNESHDLSNNSHDLSNNSHDLSNNSHDLSNKSHDLSNKSHDLSLNAKAPSVRSAYSIGGLDNSNTERVWTSFVDIMLYLSDPQRENINPVTMNSDRLISFVQLASKEHFEENIPHIKWNEDEKDGKGSLGNPFNFLWKDILIAPSEAWNSLKVFYSQH